MREIKTLILIFLRTKHQVLEEKTQVILTVAGLTKGYLPKELNYLTQNNLVAAVVITKS